jgi:hypothetical protein
MKTARIMMNIKDEHFKYGKRVICNIRYEQLPDSDWCNVYFADKTEPSMQLHILDIEAHTV